MTNLRNARLTCSLVVVLVVASPNPSRSKHDDEEEATRTSSSSSIRDRSTIDESIVRSIASSSPRASREVDRHRKRSRRKRVFDVYVCMYVVSDIRIIQNHTTYQHHISLRHTPKVGFTPAPPRSTDCVFVFVFGSSSFV